MTYRRGLAAPLPLLAPCFLLLAQFSAGCAPKPPDPIQLLAGIDANNRRIQRLKCDYVPLTAVFLDERGLVVFAGDAILRHVKPRKLYFSVRDGPVKVMHLGADDKRYWLWLEVGGISKIWWGWWKDLPDIGPEQVPLRPDWIIACLGIEDIDTGPGGPFVQVHPRYSSILYAQRDPKSGYRYLVRETRLDHRPGRPVEMLFFDRGGHEVMRSRLSDFREMQRQNTTTRPAKAPRLAHRIHLEMPGGQRLTLDLHQPVIPDSLKDRMFVMPNPADFEEEIFVGRDGNEHRYHLPEGP